MSWFRQPPFSALATFEAKYSAACFCKRVQFAVSTDPVASKLCDSSACMRLHSAPAQWAALFRKDSVRFTEDSETFLRFYNPSNDAVYEQGDDRVLPCKLQCRHCGTWVADEGRNMFVTFPTLFEFVTENGRPQFPDSFQPQAHIFSESEALRVRDGVPRFLDDMKTPLTPGDFLKRCAPPLDGSRHKGMAGRIGVLGGSVDFAGAPYYAGMAALRVGAELLYMLTAEEATGPIKSYSPELMVSSVYRWSRMSSASVEERRSEQERLVSKVDETLPRLHALTIGPGLGRDPNVLDAVARVIMHARDRQLPLVLDADGVWLVAERPDVVKGYTQAVLTPNVMEFKRLCTAVLGTDSADLSQLCEAMSGPIIIKKGPVDQISAPGMATPLECSAEGAPRRPGGLGDFLSGSLATVLGWAHAERLPATQACAVCCALVRRACRNAYAKHRRAMVAPDVLEEVGGAFEELVAEAGGFNDSMGARL